MGIQAIALLQIDVGSGASELPASATQLGPHAALLADGATRIERLDDGILLHIGVPFASEPTALSFAVHALLGDALAAQHRDPRGVLFIPDVAAPKARSYEGVIREVGEGAEWGPPLSGAGAAAEGLEALLGDMLSAMPSSVLQSASAAVNGDPQAFQALTAQLEGLLGGSGMDLSSPMFQQLAQTMQAELAKDPAQLAALADRLFGAVPADDDDDA